MRVYVIYVGEVEQQIKNVVEDLVSQIGGSSYINTLSTYRSINGTTVGGQASTDIVLGGASNYGGKSACAPQSLGTASHMALSSHARRFLL